MISFIICSHFTINLKHINFFNVKRQDFSKQIFESCAFYGLDTVRSSGTGTVTCKSEPEL
jgi:hypothetical protein